MLIEFFIFFFFFSFFRFSYFVFVFGLIVVEVFMGCNCGFIKTFLIEVIFEAY